MSLITLSQLLDCSDTSSCCLPVCTFVGISVHVCATTQPVCVQGQASEDADEQLHAGTQQPGGGDAEWHQSFDPERQRYYYWRLSPAVIAEAA